MLVYPFIFTNVKGAKVFENVFEKRALMYLRLIISIFYGNCAATMAKIKQIKLSNEYHSGWMDANGNYLLSHESDPLT